MPGRTKTKREGSDPIMSNRDHDAKNIRRLARTGTIHRYAPARPGGPHGHYVVRCSAPDGTRPLFHLKPSPKSPQAEARARGSAAAITEKLWAQRGSALRRCGPGPRSLAQRWATPRPRRWPGTQIGRAHV